MELLSYVIIGAGLVVGLYGVDGLLRPRGPARDRRRAPEEDDDIDVSDEAIARLDLRSPALLTRQPPTSAPQPPVMTQDRPPQAAQIDEAAALDAGEGRPDDEPASLEDAVVEPGSAEQPADLPNQNDDSLLALFAEVIQTGGAPAVIREAIEEIAIAELLEDARSMQRLIRPGA